MDNSDKPSNDESNAVDDDPEKEKVTTDQEDGANNDTNIKQDEEKLFGLPLTYAIVTMAVGALIIILITILLVYKFCCCCRKSKEPEKVQLKTASSVDNMNSDRQQLDEGPRSSQKLH